MSGFDRARFEAARRSAWAEDIRILGTVASTQDEARRGLDGGSEGTVFLAEGQTAGRGRWGRSWQGQAGASLLFTVLLKSEPGRAQAPSLPLLLGLASARALRTLGLHEAGVKWPNDLSWRGQKLGGILVEQEGAWWLAGCGVNVGQGAADLAALDRPAVSLALAGLALSREAVLAAMLSAWESAVAAWRAEGFSAAAADWPAVDCLQGRRCRAWQGGQALEGLALGVEPDGRLRFKAENGPERLLSSAEIELLRPVGAD